MSRWGGGGERRASRLGRGLLAGIHVWGLGFQRKASGGSCRNCFPEGLRETCQVTVCGREQGSGPRIPLWTPHGGSEIRVFLLT